MIATLLALSAMQPVAPQQRPVDPNFPIQTSRREAERTMQLYADCLVRRGEYRQRVDEFLRSTPDTAEQNALGMKLVVPNCMPRASGRAQMRIAPPLLRLALYSALYQRDFGKQAPDVANRQKLDFAAEYGGGAALPAQYTYMREIGDCVARAQPAEVRALIPTRIGSGDEDRAVAALMPTLQQCTPQGANLRFSRTVLRGTLAEGLYKLSKAPAAPAAG